MFDNRDILTAELFLFLSLGIKRLLIALSLTEFYGIIVPNTSYFVLSVLLIRCGRAAITPSVAPTKLLNAERG